MAKWNTAEELSQRYAVGVDRLAAYADRGNLGRRRLADGTLLFDEDMVAVLFRTRLAVAARRDEAFMSAGETPSMGVLGVARLGETTTTTQPRGRMPDEQPESRRHRPLRSDAVPSFAQHPERTKTTRRAAGG
jgi:hypothetical protein